MTRLCGAVLAVLSILVLNHCGSGSSPAAAEKPELDASAGCQNGRVVIVNKGSEHWFEVKIELNRVWVHETAVIPKGDTMRFFPNVFTKSDGSRLNLAATACKTIDIHATVDGERRHWNGGYN